MADRLFTDPVLAALYDSFSPWDEREDFGFYLPMVMDAESVLDVGCGTGMLLRGAREMGHTGRLCGLDPAPGMLEVARKRADIEWVHGDLSSAAWNREFDLVVMTGHAFQVFVRDEEVSATLSAIASALKPGGRFAFETRNPLAREWERWTPENAQEVVVPTGETVRMECEVEYPVEGDIVRFTLTFICSEWSQSETSRSMLRFLDSDALSKSLAEVGLSIEEQYGDWDRSPVTARSPEIITIAQRA